MTDTSVADEEVARFTALADQWWDPTGDFAPLHKINPVRLEFIRDHLCELAGTDPKSPMPLAGSPGLVKKRCLRLRSGH